MSEAKNNRIDELEKALEEQKRQTEIAKENFGKLYAQWSDVSAQCKALEDENREYIHRLNCLESKWREADEDYSRMVSVRDNLLSTTHQLADDLEGERATNKMLIDGILDLVRKIMEA